MDLYQESIQLLQSLIGLPSLSGEENLTADAIFKHLASKGVKPERKHHNVWAFSNGFDKDKHTILLNSHHDTVRPTGGYNNDPFDPILKEGKLYGLGSNDAGGALVSLLATFLHFYEQQDLPWNIVFAATGEEEISGRNGIESILGELGDVDLAIVGEPTSMQMAVAEKGLLVLDVEYKGISGHAGRGEGENAIYKSISDLSWFRDYQFENLSDLLGPVKMNVTQIDGGQSHNVTPDRCHLVVDVRCTDQYSLDETLLIISNHIEGEVKARSTRLRPSSISMDHPIVGAAQKLGIVLFGSPTLSDQALMSFPSVKIGPGDSARSHTADEFIYTDQIEKGITTYIHLLNELKDLENLKNWKQ